MTSNVAESLNSMFKKSREFPVVALLDAIQAKMSSWFNDRCKIAAGIKSPLTPLMEEKVRERWNEAENFKVNQLNAMEFDVRGDLIEALVDLGRRSCSCKVFDLEKLPCSHAIAACNSVKMDLYSFCVQCYKLDAWVVAYQGTIYPVSSESEWEVPDEVKNFTVLPPNVKFHKGRPKRKRFPSVGEVKHKKK
ncbi:hypothetical protein UlMin_030274 [Ulmus minor]